MSLFSSVDTDAFWQSAFPEPTIDPYEWKTCGDLECDGDPHEGWPRKHARLKQIAPAGSWLTWLILAGRGWGKTRTGAEWLKAKALGAPGTRWAIVAPTYPDGRDTCVEGESGLLSVLNPEDVRTWNRSLGELILTNGSRMKIFTAEEPERLRGPQHHGAWCDELAAWRYPDTWSQLQFGLRLGEHPQTVVTTTPKPVKLVKELMAAETVEMTRGSTFENRVNLAPSALSEFEKMKGTRLGRQELYAEILTDVPGAIATLDQLDAGRIKSDELPDLSRRIVSVDPAVTNTDESDETGITVQGRAGDHVYLLADLSCKADVDEWALLAVGAAVTYECGMILYESNQGGDSIGVVLKAALARYNEIHETRHSLTIKPVPARLSKYDRALPLQFAIQQVRYHIVDVAPTFEEQVTTWVPEDEKGRKMPSPNNMDAGVHGFRELMGIGGKGRTSGSQIAAARVG